MPAPCEAPNRDGHTCHVVLGQVGALILGTPGETSTPLISSDATSRAEDGYGGQWVDFGRQLVANRTSEDFF